MAATHSSSPQRLSPDTDSDVIPTEAHLTHEKGKEEIDMKGPLKNADEDMPDKKNHVPSDDHFKSPSLPTPLSLSSTQPKKGRNDKTQISHVGNQNQVPAEFQDTQKTTPTSTGNAQVSIPYEEPKWSGIAEATYSFDVLKNGSIIGSVPLASKAFYVFGRLPSCDVSLEHPSLSRYHAVMQYSVTSTPTHEKGWYIYDLDSTHGTWLNKRKILPKVYHRVKVGHIVKFGGSSRLHILQGPSDDTEEESEMTITEMKAQKEKLQKETELLRQVELQEEMQRREAERKLLEDRGCAWGMGEDAEDMEDENPYASMVAENESLYIDDPKKALKGFYEREGCDLPDYQFTEVALGKHKCRVDLPVDGPNGEELVAEAVVSGKRKDAVVACALEACRILDKLGMLRSSTHESRKRKQKKWEDDDFYDSDEDTFLDRTGTIEKKRFMRMKKAGKDEAETYQSLLEKYNTVAEQIQDIEDKLQKAKAEAEAIASEEMDELDAYMISIKSGVMDTKTRMQLKGNLLRLKGEEQKLRKLVNVAKPASLPPLKPIVPTPVAATPTPSSDSLSRKLHSHQKQLKKVTPVKIQAPVIEMKPDDFEEEDDEDEESSKNHKQEILPAVSEKQNSQTEAPSVTKRPDRTESKSEKIERPRSSETAMKGPSLPPAHVDTQSQGKKTVKPHHLSTAALLNSLDKNSGKKTKSASDPNYENSADPEYAMWLPPTEQSGDGRTSLNDKLGY